MFSKIYERVLKFEEDAHRILGKYETSPSRIVELAKTYNDLNGLSIQQDELFRQSLRCVENQLYRAAHVMSWAGFMDFLEQKIVSDGFKKLHSAYSAWSKYKTIEDLREYVSEYQIIEAARNIGLCTKSQTKALQGLLNKRNECAHPSSYYPNLNESLGYISELLQRINQLQNVNI
jgi:ribosomal protein S18